MKENIEEIIEFLQGFNDGYTFQQCQTCFKFNEKDGCCNKEKCEELEAIEFLISDYIREIDDKEVSDALHMLLHCSLKDTEYETQKQQFKIVNAYIKKLEKENEEWQGAYQEEKDKSFELVRENQKLEAENEELREEIDLYEDNIILLQKKLIDTEKRLLNYILKEKGE